MSIPLSNQQLVIALILVGYLAWEIYILFTAFASLRWRSATGKVVSSNVEDERDNEGFVMGFAPRVRYRYQVGAKSFESTRYSYQGVAFSRVEDARAQIRDLSKGADVEVFYDPKSPSRAVMVRGYGVGNFVYIGALVAFLLMTLNGAM